MRLSVVVASREDDRPPLEPLEVAATADRLGYGEVWVGEGPTWDAYALSAAIARDTERVEITVGPVPVSVRDPETIARGAADVSALAAGRPVGVALGTSSVRVVERVHGRSRKGATARMADTAAEVKRLLDRGHTTVGEPVVAGETFVRRLPAGGGPLTVAAFGDKAIAIAAEHADRMLLDLVSPDQVRDFRARLDRAAAAAGTSPRLAAWIPAAVDPADETVDQLLGSVAGYLTVPGYLDAFRVAGFGDAVDLARDGATREQLVAALPREAAEVVGLVGAPGTVQARLAAYAEAGLDELAIVPMTAGDPAAERTLTALAATPSG